MTEVIGYERVGNIALIIIDNPPVNAISHAVRQGVCDVFDQFAADDEAEAAVLMCAGRTFIAGADIREFNSPEREPYLAAMIGKIEETPKLVVAALHGTALGGGFETAMGCHYRCALETAKVGLPEVHLGLIPGAGGTQRLPRLAGVKFALETCLSGKPISAAQAHDAGIVDEVISGDLREGALAYTKKLLATGAPVKRLSELSVDKEGINAAFFDDYRAQLEKGQRGFMAPFQILKAVRAAMELPFDEGIKLEKQLFNECKASPQSKAQRYLFFAERTVTKLPDIPKETPLRDISKAAVVGSGFMGSRIAINFADAGIPIVLKDVDQQAIDRGMETIKKTYEARVQKGRLTDEQVQQRLALINSSPSYDDIADADLVVEAVFEDMDLKKKVFKELDGACKETAILASNTSALDLNEIAAEVRRPEDVIGLHFFAPADVMKLLEIVRGEKTGKDVVATAMALAKQINKTGVVVGVCYGLVGNRMFIPYIREAQLMMLQGVSPQRIDQVAYDWGMAMGPNAVTDLSGMDVFHNIVKELPDRKDDPVQFRLIFKLFDMGRYGQKTGAGIYNYEGRKPVPAPEVMELAAREAQQLGIEQCEISEQEISERLFYAMINEGAKVLDEKIAIRPEDIDVIWISGFGMPRYRGGPMFYADTIGLDTVYSGVCKFRDRYGEECWTPSPLLERLAKEGKTFAEWSQENN